MDGSPFLHGCIVCVVGIVITLIMLVNTMKKTTTRGGSRAGMPPGSEGMPLIGETLQFMAAISTTQGFYQFVQVRRLKYGESFKTNIFGTTNVFFGSTRAAKAILSNGGDNFTKRYIRSVGELVGDCSVLCASTQHHRFIRARLSSLFSLSSLSIFTQQFDHLVMENLSNWEYKAGNVVVLREALKVTFKAMCRILISLESGHEMELLEKDVARVCDAMLSFPLKLPFTRFYKGIKARKRIMQTLGKVINSRRKGLESHQDFLQCLLEEDPDDRDGAAASSSNSATDETQKKLTDEEIQDNVLTMIIAGQDTTASAITWMVKYLADNEQVLDKLKAEHLGLVKNSLLTLEDLNRMSFASKVVKESLRMASIVAWYPRLVIQDCEIDGYAIKAGWSVNVDARSIHLNSTIHRDPDKFNPSRFDDGQGEGDAPKPYGFLPFSMGGRTCLGMHMAKAMMLVFLHRLITTYRWEVIDSDSSIEKWAMFARLKSGCPIHVTRTTTTTTHA